MRLENVLALTHGSLMSHPSISFFDDIVIEASRVKRGSLFIALNHHDISLAIDNGAYGIIFDKDVDIKDSENAWIKVDDTYDALLRLMRFLLIDKELDTFTCNNITLQVAKQLITPNNFIILEGSLSENFSKLLLAPQNATVLFVATQIQDRIFTNKSSLNDSTKKIKIIEQTLFETAFIYDDVFYERQYLSAFFIPYLEKVLNLLSKKNISFKIKNTINIPHFQAQFINKNLHVKDFGTTNRVIIFEKDLSIVDKEIEFISKNVPWAKFICLAPYKSENIISYNSEEEAIKILKNSSFNFALVVGLDISILDKIKDYPVQKLLF